MRIRFGERGRPAAAGLLVALLAAGTPAASRAGPAVRVVAPGKAPVRNVVNVRFGSLPEGAPVRPTVCVEVSPAGWISAEACGNGSGFLHREAAPEMAHFRAKAWLARGSAGRSSLRLGVGAGLAELQIAADRPGFRVGGEPDPEGIEAAGPEITLEAEWLLPAEDGLELVASASAGVAWLPGAPALATPMASEQPFVLVTVGVGW